MASFISTFFGEDGIFNDFHSSDHKVDDIDSNDSNSKQRWNDFGDEISIDSNEPYNCKFDMNVD